MIHDRSQILSSIIDNEVRVIHSKSNNIELMINDEANKVIKELFDTLKRYQNNLESMNSSGFVFDYVYLNVLK